MSRLRARVVALWALASLTGGSLAVQVWLWAAARTFSLGAAIGLALLLAFAVFVFWLTWRVPDNAVAWTLSAGISSVAVNQVAYSYFEQAAALGYARPEIGFLIHNIFFWPGIALLAVLAATFPTGRALSPRWNVTFWLAAIGVVPQVVKTFYLVATVPLVDLMDRPTGLPWLDTAFLGGQWLIAMSIGAGLLSLVVRFVQSRGAERRQMLYVVPSIALLTGFWLVEVVYEQSDIALLMLALGSASLPVAMGLAILRYRLYEIDRILSRTVTYALVIGLLGGAVALIAALVGAQFDNPTVVAATTLGVAAAFNPLRRRVQGVVDRRFNRTRHEAGRVITEFGQALRDQIDADQIADAWGSVVTTTMQPSTVGLWVRR